MGTVAVMGAVTKCTFGLAPSVLMVLPVNRTMVGGPPGGNIMDSKPLVNVLPFGMCNSIANPMVAAATAAALGALTPMPCIPVTAAPWVPGVPKALLGNMPLLNNSCKCMCSWGGVISINMPGQFLTMA